MRLERAFVTVILCPNTPECPVTHKRSVVFVDTKRLGLVQQSRTSNDVIFEYSSAFKANPQFYPS